MEKRIYQYKITLKQQLIVFGPSLFTWIGLFIGIVFIFNDSIFNPVRMVIFPFVFFIDTLPTIVLHMQYWKKNHNALLTINSETKELSYEKKLKQLKYSFFDIEAI